MSAPHPSHDLEVGLLDADRLDASIEAELARAGRHELPLTLVLIEVSGTALREGSGLRERVARTVAETLRERTRREDYAARLAPFRFAVLAVETGESEVLAAGLADHVRKSLSRLGPEGRQLFVTTGAVDCQYDELSRPELLETAERALSAAAGTEVLRKSA